MGLNYVRTVTIYNYQCQVTLNFSVLMLLEVKRRVSQKEEGREVRTQAWTRRVESGTTTTCASVEGF